MVLQSQVKAEELEASACCAIGPVSRTCMWGFVGFMLMVPVCWPAFCAGSVSFRHAHDLHVSPLASIPLQLDNYIVLIKSPEALSNRCRHIFHSMIWKLGLSGRDCHISILRRSPLLRVYARDVAAQSPTSSQHGRL